MTSETEYELLYQARQGERAAFDDLQKSLEGSVRRFIRKLIGVSDYEDPITQDAFLALYLNIERIHPSEHLRPFLFRVVRNLCYDELRRKGRYQIVSLDDDSARGSEAFTFLVDPTPQPDEAVTRNYLYGQVRSAIESLPEAQRQTFLLHFEEEMSYAQIAEAMQTDVGTVKSRVHSGRKNLKKLLGPEILRALNMNKQEEHT